MNKPAARRTARAATRQSQRAFSLVEGLVAMTISALALGLGVPGFGAAKERRHLEGAAAQLETDIQLARSEAVGAGHTVRLRFPGQGANCYVLYTGATNACTCNAGGGTTCSAGAQALRSQTFNPHGVTLQSNVNAMVFEPTHGTVTPTGTVRLVGQDQRSVRVIVSLLGRVRSCTPSSAMPGYKAC